MRARATFSSASRVEPLAVDAVLALALGAQEPVGNDLLDLLLLEAKETMRQRDLDELVVHVGLVAAVAEDAQSDVERRFAEDRELRRVVIAAGRQRSLPLRVDLGEGHSHPSCVPTSTERKTKPASAVSRAMSGNRPATSASAMSNGSSSRPRAWT